MNLLKALQELEKVKKAAALCTIVGIKGSTPRKVGTKMLVLDNNDDFGAIVGTIGGGAIEHHIRQEAIKVLKTNKAVLSTTSLRNDLGMCCGGEMTVFIEPLQWAPSFFLFGAGHIAQALAPIALALGFEVTVIDERKELLEHPSFAPCKRVLEQMSPFSCSNLPFGPLTFALVTTHDHALDQQIIELCLRQELKYLALVGSQRKALMTQKRLYSKGFTADEIEKIVCPAGLSINASTPLEIALSIAGQMIEVKNASIQCNNSSSGLKPAQWLS